MNDNYYLNDSGFDYDYNNKNIGQNLRAPKMNSLSLNKDSLAYETPNPERFN